MYAIQIKKNDVSLLFQLVKHQENISFHHQLIIISFLFSSLNKLKQISDQSEAEERSKNLFNGEGARFYMPVVVILAILIIIVVIGACWDVNKSRNKAKG